MTNHIDSKNCFAEAIRIIQSKEASCAVIQNETIVHTATGRGVKPLIQLFDHDPGKLKGCTLADKIIGKAAAMILHLGGASRVYGEIMSQSARTYLLEHGIGAEFGRCVPVIAARTGSGICPIERSVLCTDDPTEGLQNIRGVIAQLMKQSG